MKLLAALSLAASAMTALAYDACSTDTNQLNCCSLGLLGLGIGCTKPANTPTSRDDFKAQCGKKTPFCCNTRPGLLGAGCLNPADDPPPPTYNPCPSNTSPAARCCELSLSGSIFCNDDAPAPPPTDLDNFKAICKADDKRRAYCCRIDDEGVTFACEAAK